MIAVMKSASSIGNMKSVSWATACTRTQCGTAEREQEWEDVGGVGRRGKAWEGVGRRGEVWEVVERSHLHVRNADCEELGQLSARVSVDVKVSRLLPQQPGQREQPQTTRHVLARDREEGEICRVPDQHQQAEAEGDARPKVDLRRASGRESGGRKKALRRR